MLLPFSELFNSEKCNSTNFSFWNELVLIQTFLLQIFIHTFWNSGSAPNSLTPNPPLVSFDLGLFQSKFDLNDENIVHLNYTDVTLLVFRSYLKNLKYFHTLIFLDRNVIQNFLHFRPLTGSYFCYGEDAHKIVIKVSTHWFWLEYFQKIWWDTFPVLLLNNLMTTFFPQRSEALITCSSF